MKNYKNIMMVKTNLTSNEYIVKDHFGNERIYMNIIKLPKYILKWMEKHTHTNDMNGNTIWM